MNEYSIIASSHASQMRRTRYAFLDALRGVACLAVVFHHASNVLEAAADRTTGAYALPKWLHLACSAGSGGVQVFFVLSGFVIALSLNVFVPTRSTLANFIIRRQLRLDPTYWVALIGATLLLLTRPGSQGAPSVSVWIANATYLHGVLRLRDVLGVAWTLCIEIQFYLVFATILWVAALCARRFSICEKKVAALLMIALALASVICPRQSGNANWFLPVWIYFAAGAFTYWVSIQRLPRWALLAALLPLLLSMAGTFRPAFVGLGTCVAIFGTATAGRMTQWSGGLIIQYLGRISYSLYLVHLPIMTTIFLRGSHPNISSYGRAIAWTIILPVVSVCLAHVVHVAVEAPTARLAGRLKRRDASPSPTSRQMPEMERPPGVAIDPAATM